MVVVWVVDKQMVVLMLYLLVVELEIHNIMEILLGFQAYLAVLIEVVVVLVLKIHTVQLLLVVH